MKFWPSVSPSIIPNFTSALVYDASSRPIPPHQRYLMASPEPSIRDRVFINRTVEAVIRIAVVAALVWWCFIIAKPFLLPIIGGAIIAVTVFRGYQMLEAAFGGRRITAAVLVTFLILVMLVVPSVLLGESLVSGVNKLVDSFQNGSLSIPPPPDSVARWPLIGEPIARVWTLASQDLVEAFRQASPLLTRFGSWLLSAAQGASVALLQLVLAIFISGAFLANSQAASRATRAVASRLAGERGLILTDVAESTVRSVASGILGVALIQALLAGLGFLVAGVPAAGLLTLICLITGVIQLGVVIVLIPVAIYLFSTADTTTAVGFLIWAILIAPIDNILKPMLLGRGVDVPMLVIFVGAIGGFLSSGIIGLFLGAVVLALGYKLFLVWLKQEETHSSG
jgi:predicted PurR-regulated permease PerM